MLTIRPRAAPDISPGASSPDITQPYRPAGPAVIPLVRAFIIEIEHVPTQHTRKEVGLPCVNCASWPRSH